MHLGAFCYFSKVKTTLQGIFSGLKILVTIAIICPNVIPSVPVGKVIISSLIKIQYKNRNTKTILKTKY